jgi:hypothetical protein
MKECSTCLCKKPKSEFNKQSANKDGLRGQCRECQKLTRRAYYEKTKDHKKEYAKANEGHIKEYQKKYYQSNQERLKENSKSHRDNNKDYYKEYNAKYQEDNQDSIRAKKKEYYAENKEYFLDKFKRYRKDNREYYKSYSKGYLRERRKTDPLFRLAHNIRNLILISFTYNGYSKEAKTFEILGCTFEEFKVHIEKQFTDGMSWDNRGLWHLDHIYPVSKAADEEHLIKLNHYTNFQPLWAMDNLRKGNKLPDELA